MTADNRKQRLRRLDRTFVRTPIYFVTTCTDNRRQILASESIRKTFVGF
jgi:REP element-mobilizing transposase RayT